jgi:dienelactone hydrolase
MGITSKSAQIRSEKPQYPGYLYIPEAPGPHPGILLLHGSEGGYGDFWTMPGELPFPTGESKYTVKLAKHFATLGFVAYAYSYFHADGIDGFSSYPPSELVNVDISDTGAALEWLRSSPYVCGLPVGMWGGSRGAEHALVLSSMATQLKNLNVFPDLVIADSPSDFVYPGLSKVGADALSNGAPFPEVHSSAWSINGNPIEMFSPIEIEKIKAPILINYGAEDEVWGPYVDIRKLEDRLNSNGRHALHFDFGNNDNPKIMLDLIAKKLSEENLRTPTVFIRFLNEGHNPKPNTNSSILQAMITEFFLKKYLCY